MKRKVRKNLVGPKIRALRSDLGMTQNQFAAKCQLHGFDISLQVLGRIEAQFRCVDDFEIVKFCKILSVTPDQLLEYKPTKRDARRKR